MKRLVITIASLIIVQLSFAQTTFMTSGQGSGSFDEAESWLYEDGSPAARAPQPTDHLLIRHHITHVVAEAYTHTGNIEVTKEGIFEILPSNEADMAFTFQGNSFDVFGGLLVSGKVVLGDASAANPSYLSLNPSLMAQLYGDVVLEQGIVLLQNNICGFNTIAGNLSLYPNKSSVIGTGRIIVSGDLQMMDDSGNVMPETADAKKMLAAQIGNKTGIYANIEACEANQRLLAGTQSDEVAAYTFKHLSAVHDGNAVNITWDIDGDQAQLTFEIERSLDSLVFGGIHTEVNQLRGASFYAIDRQPYVNHSYYRIKVTTTDGQVSYSPVVKAHQKRFASMEGEMKVFPNPAQRGEFVQLALTEMKPINNCVIEVRNIMGQVVYQTSTLTNANGEAFVTLPMNVEAGSYFVMAQADNVKQVKTLTIF